MLFFIKSGHFFDFQKRSWEVSPSHLVVHQCGWICINIPEYPCISLKMQEETVLTMPDLWICLINLLFWQAFEDSSGSKCARVLNIALLHMREWHWVLNISEYGSICLNVSIGPNAPQYAWTWLIIAECPCFCLKMQGSQYASSSYIVDRVLNILKALNMPEFWICRDIVLITLLL